MNEIYTGVLLARLDEHLRDGSYDLCIATSVRPKQNPSQDEIKTARVL